jgi:hypothetical protein
LEQKYSVSGTNHDYRRNTNLDRGTNQDYMGNKNLVRGINHDYRRNTNFGCGTNRGTNIQSEEQIMARKVGTKNIASAEQITTTERTKI